MLVSFRKRLLKAARYNLHRTTLHCVSLIGKASGVLIDIIMTDIFSLVIISTLLGAQKNPNKQSHNHTKNKEFPSVIKFSFHTNWQCVKILKRWVNYPSKSVFANLSFLYFRNLALYF